MIITPLQSHTAFSNQPIQIENTPVDAKPLAEREQVTIGHQSSSVLIYSNSRIEQSTNTTLAARNILDFIATQLASDAISGADKEDLQSRLQAGLEGFLKGYEEASRQLLDSGLLTPEVVEDIENTYSNVINGIAQLANQYEVEVALPEASGLETEKYNVNPAQASKIDGPLLNVSAEQARSFDFSLKTRDGDDVVIKLNAQRSGAISFDDLNEFRGHYSEQQGFTFQVEGQLDSEEIQAINDLLNKNRGYF